MTLKEWIKQYRQWPRKLRIEHARMQLSKASTKEAKDFWRKVIEINTQYLDL
jgi:hypothetical protein